MVRDYAERGYGVLEDLGIPDFDSVCDRAMTEAGPLNIPLVQRPTSLKVARRLLRLPKTVRFPA